MTESLGIRLLADDERGIIYLLVDNLTGEHAHSILIGDALSAYPFGTFLLQPMRLADGTRSPKRS